MLESNDYLSDPVVVILALIGGLSAQKDIHHQVWKIVWSESLNGNEAPSSFICDLEQQGYIKTKNLRVAASDYLRVWVKSMPPKYPDKPYKEPSIRKSENSLAGLVNKLLALNKEGTVTGFLKIQNGNIEGLGGLEFDFDILNPAIEDVAKNYIDRFIKGELHSNDANEPWAWKRQKEYALSLVDSNSKNYEDEITISQNDIEGSEAQRKFKLLLTYMALAQEELLELGYVDIDYTHKNLSTRPPTNKSHESFLKVKLLSNYSSTQSQQIAQSRSDIVERGLAQTESEHSDKAKIKYDKELHQIVYGDNEPLPIKGDLNRQVCRQVFKNRKKVILFVDILDRVDENKQSRAVYDSVKRINNKVEEKYRLRNLLDAKNERVRISKNYL